MLLGLVVACDGSPPAPVGPANVTPPADLESAQTPSPATVKDPSVLPDRSVPVVPGALHFSRDMFSDRIPTWTRQLAPFVGRPDLHYLEIGVFEGRSVVWMLDHVLTHPSARVTAIDIFPADLRQTFLANVQRAGHADKVTTIEGASQAELRKLPLDSVDIVYIDGSHTADDVLADAVLSWGLLRPGGVMIFDDFMWVGRGGKNLLPPELRPALGVSSFIANYRNEIEVLHNAYQVVIKKIANPCHSKHYCTPVGSYVYHWRASKLVTPDTGAEVPLSEVERGFIERIAQSRPFGQVGYSVEPELAADPAYVEMVARLGLELVEPVNPLSAVDRRNLLGTHTCGP